MLKAPPLSMGDKQVIPSVPCLDCTHCVYIRAPDKEPSFFAQCLVTVSLTLEKEQVPFL